jgi:hypothetical protein
MPNRLVDIANKNDRILHTFPIAVGGTDIAPADTVYEAKALSAAGHARLVPNAELEDLTAKMHVSRRGPLAPYGDDRHILAETKTGLDQIVRERAYLCWEQDGCPDGNAETHWHQAHDQHLRERAYVMWQQEGCPEGQADTHWYRTCNFEAE